MSCLWIVLALCSALLFAGAVADDHIHVHSLFPPILKNYWANGMQYWAFGRETVVTDNYVQLTTMDQVSAGYLWNCQRNRLDDFELNVTVQMRSRDGAWFASGGDSGFGIWYAGDEKVSYITDSSFFGFKRRFRGLGVVLDHANELHLVESDGSFSLNPTSLRNHRVGSCTIGSLGELHATITLLYRDKRLGLFYATHPGDVPTRDDYANAVLCASIDRLALLSNYHFGVTAANSAQGQAVHNVRSVTMTPLSQGGPHEGEPMVGQPRIFDSEFEVTEGLEFVEPEDHKAADDQ